MDEVFARDYLHNDLREVREVMLWKLDGLSEYDIRRPLTSTGTNLLGLVKHLTITEVRYFGDVFDRPFSEHIPEFSHADTWVTPHESRTEIVDGYRAACVHSDRTIEALDLDAPGHVPWWPLPNVKLFDVLIHVLTETTRHAGHADILREQIDGAVGSGLEDTGDSERGPEFWTAHRSKVEEAAQAMGFLPGAPGSPD
jgi:hypothetical protein